MWMWPLPFALFLFLSAPVKGGLREILQSQNTANVTIVETEEALRNAVEKLAPNDVVLINADRISLSQTLVINVADVTIRGREASSTTLSCPDRDQASSMSIRQDNVTIEQLSFSTCNGNPTVMIEGGRSAVTESLRVAMSGVQFSGHQAEGKMGVGSAVNISSCEEEDCVVPVVSITSCLFEHNVGEAGAAIFAQNCQLGISHSIFRDNAALAGGGAVYITGNRSALKVNFSKFESNMAYRNASSLFNNSESWNLSDSSYGSEGGAIHSHDVNSVIIGKSTFDSNQGCSGAGAIFFHTLESTDAVSENSTFQIKNCNFTNNRASCDGQSVEDLQNFFRTRLVNSGGAITSDIRGKREYTWIVKNSTFLSNSAVNGGAMYVTATSEWNHSIVSSQFDRNRAVTAGGCILAASAHLHLEGVNLTSSEGLYGGGIILIRESSLTAHPFDSKTPTIFLNNTAHFGGGLQCNSRYTVELYGVIFRNNTAYRQGGGLRCYDSMQSVELHGVTFDSNHAIVGGGIAFTASANITMKSYSGQKTVFRNNGAMVGGGLHYSPGHFFQLIFKVSDTEFIGNKAFDFKQIERAHKNKMKMQDADTFLGSIEAGSKVENMTRDLRQRTDTPSGHGGGLCMTMAEIPTYAIAEVVFTNVSFTRNRAKIGGGLDIYLKKANWSVDPSVHCFPARYGVHSCQIFIFQNVNIVENKAKYAGGIFSTNPESILLTCKREESNSSRTLLQLLFPRINNSTASQKFDSTEVCTKIEHNKISDSKDIPGADAGSTAKSLFLVDVHGPLKTVASGEELTLPCESKEDNHRCPKNLTVAVKDAFNQTIVRGIKDSCLRVLLTSDNISGETSYHARKGIVTIDHTLAEGINITKANLSIVSFLNSSLIVNTSFSTRPCQIGESTQGNMCRECPSDQYGFDPSLTKCENCETNAHCPGGAALIPVNGFWHSSPFSPQFHRCFYQAACEFENRTEQLAKYYENITQVEKDWKALENYVFNKEEKPFYNNYNQCAEGYVGSLCGSCIQGYGRSGTGACTKCPNGKIIARVLVSIALLWTLVMIAINSGITLASAKARVQLFLQELHTRTAEGRRPRQLGRAGHIDSAVVERALERIHAVSGHMSEVDGVRSRLMLTRHLVSTVQLTETLKILVNYLQVTSAALRLQVNWNSAMDGLLSVQAAFVGVASEAIDVPFECNFENEKDKVHPSILAIWLRILSPWFVLIALIFLFTLIWIPVHFQKKREQDIVAKLREKLGHRSWLTCVIVISIVTIHFSFIDMITELFRSVNCITVDEKSVALSSPAPYRNYSTESGYKVWVEDTSLKCFQGSHKATGIAGVVGLFCAALVIVFIIVWLPLNKKHRKEQDFLARYWFIYQGYRRRWYTSSWEAAILIRKALIAAVVVFSVHLGRNLQASLCVGILILAHVLQIVFHPFKQEEDYEAVPEYFDSILASINLSRLNTWWMKFNNSLSLNAVESASLVSSALFYYLAVILNDSYSSDEGESIMAAFTFAVNFIFLLFVFFRLYAGLHVTLDLYLEAMDPAFTLNHENGPGICSLCCKMFQVLALRYDNWAHVPDETHRSSFSSIDFGSIELSACLDLFSDNSTHG